MRESFVKAITVEIIPNHYDPIHVLQSVIYHERYVQRKRAKEGVIQP